MPLRVVYVVKLPLYVLIYMSALPFYLMQFAYIAEGQSWCKRCVKLVSSGELPGRVFELNEWWHCFFFPHEQHARTNYSSTILKAP